MNRITKTLAHLQANNTKMLSPYITAGDPDLTQSLTLMHALVEAGADIIELGIPFSDPMAEGPVIQAAMERALLHNVSCDDVFNLVEKFRSRNQQTPIVLMGYVNPVEYYGYEAFAKRAHDCGVDGLILVDMPPEESKDTQALWDKYDLLRIYLCSPTTSDARMEAINSVGQGYLYYVSLKGVTGSSALNVDGVKVDYERRKTQTHLPLIVGFGIKTSDTAKAVAQFADGVIVGAALVDAVQCALRNDEDPVDAAKSLISGMRSAIDTIGNEL